MGNLLGNCTFSQGVTQPETTPSSKTANQAIKRKNYLMVAVYFCTLNPTAQSGDVIAFSLMAKNKYCHWSYIPMYH